MPLKKHLYLCPQAFGHYFAGRWEGDGHVHIKDVTTGKPSLHITMGLNQKPSAEKLYHLICYHAGQEAGSLNFRQDNQSCEVNIFTPQALKTVVQLAADKFRTPKAYSMNVVVDWLNRHFDTSLPYAKIRPFTLDDAWFAGWTDADGNFYVRLSSKPRIKVECVYQTNQKTKDKMSGFDFKPLFESMACLLYARVYPIDKKGRPYYLVKAGNLRARNCVLNYFHLYPLLTSKQNDFEAWAGVDKLMRQGNHKLHFKAMLALKMNMNLQRTVFSWAHLNFKSCFYEEPYEGKLSRTVLKSGR